MTWDVNQSIYGGATVLGHRQRQFASAVTTSTATTQSPVVSHVSRVNREHVGPVLDRPEDDSDSTWTLTLSTT